MTFAVAPGRYSGLDMLQPASNVSGEIILRSNDWLGYKELGES